MGFFTNSKGEKIPLTPKSGKIIVEKPKYAKHFGRDIPIHYIDGKPYVTRDHFHFERVVDGRPVGWADPALPSLPSIGNKTPNLRYFSDNDDRVHEFRKTMRRDVNELKPFIKKEGTKNSFILEDLAPRRYPEDSGKKNYSLAYEDHTKGLGYGKGVITKMSPEQFLSLTPPIARSEKSIEFQKKRLREGKQIGIPSLKTEPTEYTYSDGEFKKSDKQKVVTHEGRHRATASKELGIKEIPVLVYRGDYGRKFTDDEAKAIKSGKLLREDY